MGVRGRWLLASAVVVAGLACRREDPQIRELTERAAQADEASRQLRQAWSDQLRRFATLGVRQARPDASLLLLSDDQKRALEARVRSEKDNSRRALIRETLEKDQELRGLRDRLAGLQTGLPEPEVVQRNDSHYGMAMRFLQGRGCSMEEARRLLSRVPISAKLAPGFEVYHFYLHGAYASWVAQGTAPFTPQDLGRGDVDQIESQRDKEVGRGARLQKELAALADQKKRIEEEMTAIRQERAGLLQNRGELEAANARQLAKLNALHYAVGVRSVLEKEGVIETPFFDKDRSGRNWRDRVFTRHLDLRTGHTIQIEAAELGLKRISKVNVVPGSYLPDEHYRLSFGPDRQTVTVELLAPSRFKNDKVVFAVVE
ncbi:hypothetical protein [Geothrix sp. 21YS21S-4]|uniref:hypothetical protein n=1 Tax=Geothrix sp. 21YS21S-4 TaxID=3068889 RepID=UPI0027B8DD28|nr:hypothetical protein [Geothrix sp. 21YS21S-4]